LLAKWNFSSTKSSY